MEQRYQVKVIERNAERCAYLSEKLHESIVLNGEGSDKDLLTEENIEDTDVFLALTNDDEANIMSSLLAKRWLQEVMTIINNPAYVDLVQGGEIDIAISPQLATIGSLLAHVRRGDVVAVHSLRRGAAEAWKPSRTETGPTRKSSASRLETLSYPRAPPLVPLFETMKC